MEVTQTSDRVDSELLCRTVQPRCLASLRWLVYLLCFANVIEERRLCAESYSQTDLYRHSLLWWCLEPRLPHVRASYLHSTTRCQVLALLRWLYRLAGFSAPTIKPTDVVW